ncbi:MAG: hypothetical protein J5764_05795 [Bacteroidales bacterium]|nr:hypothetical protein [Bacteroidales bacterium]
MEEKKYSLELETLPEEGQSALPHHIVKDTADTGHSRKIDKKKLIIYSEILRPKFDA